MSSLKPDEFIVIVTALAVLVNFAFWRLVPWVQKAPLRPNPWDEETEDLVQTDAATPVCHRCLTPAPPGQWFCEICGTAVGPYNNWMPYLYLFSEGEILRSGVIDHVRSNALTVMGYVLFSVAILGVAPDLLVVAPVYWFLVFRNLSARGAEEGKQAA